MFGQINKITTVAGKRNDVLRLVLAGSYAMPGCLSYVAAADLDDPDAIRVTEVWENAEMQGASMDLPDVKSAVAAAMPMIAGFETVATTDPTIAT